MGWRSYTDPSDLQVWWTDDAGNFLTDTQYKKSVGGSSGGGNSGGGYNYGGGYNPGYGASTQYVGGSGQLDNANAAAQIALAIRRLEEVEIPGLNLQQKQTLINALTNMQNSTGYVNPAIWQEILGAMGGNSSGGGAAGTYTTVNGNKTVAQMRQELAAASGGMDWSGKSDQEIVDQYKQTTGGNVTANTASGTGGNGMGGSSSTRQQMIDWGNDWTSRNGGTPPNSAQWIQRFRQITGTSQEQATQMWNRLSEYHTATGGSYSGRTDWYPSDAEFNTWQQQIAPQKTLDRDRLDELKRQFDAAQGLDRERLLASLSGPKDWIKYQIAQSRMPAGSSPDLMSMFRNTPSFGAMTPDPSNSWENAWANKGKTGDGSDFTQSLFDSGKPPIGGTGTQPIEQPRVGIDPRQPSGGVLTPNYDIYRGKFAPGGEQSQQLMSGPGNLSQAPTQDREPWMQPRGYQDLLGGAGAGSAGTAAQAAAEGRTVPDYQAGLSDMRAKLWQGMQAGYGQPQPTPGGEMYRVQPGMRYAGGNPDFDESTGQYRSGRGQPQQTLGGNTPPDNSGNWEYVQFPDTSMGNRDPNRMYAQVITPGWKNKQTGEVRRAGQYGGAQPPQGQPTTWQRMVNGLQTGYGSTMPVTGQPGGDVYRREPFRGIMPGEGNLGMFGPRQPGQPGEDPRRPVGPPEQYQPPPKQPWYGFTQPNQIDPRSYNRMSPTQKAMLDGQYSAAGVDPQDAWDRMRKSWSGSGGANTRTTWR